MKKLLRLVLSAGTDVLVRILAKFLLNVSRTNTKSHQKGVYQSFAHVQTKKYLTKLILLNVKNHKNIYSFIYKNYVIVKK